MAHEARPVAADSGTVWPPLNYEDLAWAGQVDSRWNEFATGRPAQYSAAAR